MPPPPFSSLFCCLQKKRESRKTRSLSPLLFRSSPRTEFEADLSLPLLFWTGGGLITLRKKRCLPYSCEFRNGPPVSCFCLGKFAVIYFFLSVRLLSAVQTDRDLRGFALLHAPQVVQPPSLHFLRRSNTVARRRRRLVCTGEIACLLFPQRSFSISFALKETHSFFNFLFPLYSPP